MREWFKRHQRGLLFAAIDLVWFLAVFGLLVANLDTRQLLIVFAVQILTVVTLPFIKGVFAGFLGYEPPGKGER